MTPETKTRLQKEITNLEDTYDRFYHRYSTICHNPIFNETPVMRAELLEMIADYLNFTSTVLRARRDTLAEIEQHG